MCQDRVLALVERARRRCDVILAMLTTEHPYQPARPCPELRSQPERLDNMMGTPPVGSLSMGLSVPILLRTCGRWVHGPKGSGRRGLASSTRSSPLGIFKAAAPERTTAPQLDWAPAHGTAGSARVAAKPGQPCSDHHQASLGISRRRLDPTTVTTVVPVSKPYVAEGLQGAADGRPVEQVGDDLRDRRHGDETTPYPPIGRDRRAFRSIYRDAIQDASSPSELVASLAPHVRPVNRGSRQTGTAKWQAHANSIDYRTLGGGPGGCKTGDLLQTTKAPLTAER